jgi:hypothetical protein
LLLLEDVEAFQVLAKLQDELGYCAELLLGEVVLGEKG